MTKDSDDVFSLEASKPKFLGGKQGGNLTREQFTAAATEFFDAYLYKFASEMEHREEELTEYKSNFAFWNDAINENLYPAKLVTLKNFHLCEWVPLTPGKYYTPEAQRLNGYVSNVLKNGAYVSDYILNNVYDDSNGILLPTWKEGSVLIGGVGSLRLRPLDSGLYCLGATSTGITHQGIPVIVNDREYTKIISKIKKHGGVLVNILGTIDILPKERSLIVFPRKMPRICVTAREISIIETSGSKDILATVANIYSEEEAPSFLAPNAKTDDDRYSEYTLGEKFKTSWTFCSFHPGLGEKSVHEAVDWLRGYAIRFSGVAEPYFLSDFDEQFDHFPSQVSFPLKDLLHDKINVALLMRFSSHFRFTFNVREIVMGDSFKNIHNSTIINRSNIQSSFNVLNQRYDPEIAEALLRLAEEILSSHNTEAAELFMAFNKELQKARPKKPLLKSTWNGICTALPQINQQTDVVEKITHIFN